jgi:2-(1,2-epoxy-1,2-dihydrophenyl)acetyl-CoA isomerase
MGTLGYTLKDGVATLALQCKSTRNAIDITIIRELHRALDQIQKDTNGVRALVLTGSDGVFCSGVDLQSIDLERPEARQRDHCEMRKFMDPLVLRFGGLRQPIVAAVNGPAVGAGMSLALASDIIVMGESAYFWPSFARLGLVPDAGITFRLARRIGGGRSLCALLLADKIAARTAMDWGLAYSVVPDTDVVGTAQAMAQRLASGPRSVLAQIRHLHSSAFDNSLTEQLRAERHAQESVAESHECVEGVRAFFAKREPNFSPH